MRRAAKHAGKYILLLIMLVCFGHILAMGTEIGGYGTPVIYYLKEGYSLSTVQDMRKNDEELENYLPFTAVGSLDQQTFTNDDLGKTLTGTLTYIYGSSENLCSSDGELMEDDLTGCVLSSKAAWELFGESAITEGIVTYNEKSYYVRGVYEDTNAVVILPAEAVFDKKQSGNSGRNNYPASDAETSAPSTDTGTASADSRNTGNAAQEPSFSKIVIKPGTEISGNAEKTEYLQAFENRWGLGSDKNRLSDLSAAGGVFYVSSSGIDSDSCGDSRYPVSDGQQVPSFLAGGRICGAGCDDHGVLCHLSGKTVDSCGYDTEYLV